MVQEFRNDLALMEFLLPDTQKTVCCPPASGETWQWLKDPGQRNACRCIVSKDIGQYSTCPHCCVYCYANSSPHRACRNYKQHTVDRDDGIFHDAITG